MDSTGVEVWKGGSIASTGNSTSEVGRSLPTPLLFSVCIAPSSAISRGSWMVRWIIDARSELRSVPRNSESSPERERSEWERLRSLLPLLAEGDAESPPLARSCPGRIESFAIPRLTLSIRRLGVCFFPDLDLPDDGSAWA